MKPVDKFKIRIPDDVRKKNGWKIGEKIDSWWQRIYNSDISSKDKLKLRIAYLKKEEADKRRKYRRFKYIIKKLEEAIVKRNVVPRKTMGLLKKAKIFSNF